MNLYDKTVTSQFSEETLAKYRDPQFIGFAKQALAQIDPMGNLEEQDINLIVDVFTIEELRDKETAKQFFAEHALGIYGRDKMVLATLLGQLQKDEFFNEEEADTLTKEVITQSHAKTSSDVSSSSFAEKRQEIPLQSEQVATNAPETFESAQVTVPAAEKEKASKKDKVVKGVLASLLAVALIVIAIMGYFMNDMSKQLSASNTNKTIKSNRVSKLEDQIEILESEKEELQHYKNAAELYDEYAVIVVPDVDHYYHRINCSHLPDSYEYWTYNDISAADDGYSRCPDCMPVDFDDYVQNHF